MLVPLPTLAGLFESRPFFEVIAGFAGSVSVWAHAHLAKGQADPVADLMERVQHPVRYGLKHPLYAVKQVGRGLWFVTRRY